MNWKSVTVAFKVVNFFVSYADAPWCAKIGVETARSATATANNKKALVFMEHLELARISHCRARRVNAKIAREGSPFRRCRVAWLRERAFTQASRQPRNSQDDSIERKGFHEPSRWTQALGGAGVPPAVSH
jgi:hypothetical protein